MRIFLNECSNKPLILKASVDLSAFSIRDNPTLRKILSSNVETSVIESGDIIEIDVRMEAEVELECAYTLEPFMKKIRLHDQLIFTFDKENEDPNIFPISGNYIDLDPYLFGLLLTEIPLKAVKPGAKLPKVGDGVRILSEEEYAAGRGKNNPFEGIKVEEDE
ncbi:MAG TPA: DUF177 domain-containing protein [Bacilli bacterium]|nr:DUF177 domain-containing protein [Bacilli bacterium]